jgi:hypothetical protein
MNGTKPAIKSIGIMGPLIGLIVLGVNWKWPGMGITEADVAPVLELGAGLFAAVAGIWGRYRATKQVTLT